MREVPPRGRWGTKRGNARGRQLFSALCICCNLVPDPLIITIQNQRLRRRQNKPQENQRNSPSGMGKYAKKKKMERGLRGRTLTSFSIGLDDFGRNPIGQQNKYQALSTGAVDLKQGTAIAT